MEFVNPVTIWVGLVEKMMDYVIEYDWFAAGAVALAIAIGYLWSALATKQMFAPLKLNWRAFAFKAIIIAIIAGTSYARHNNTPISTPGRLACIGRGVAIVLILTALIGNFRRRKTNPRYEWAIGLPMFFALMHMSDVFLLDRPVADYIHGDKNVAAFFYLFEFVAIAAMAVLWTVIAVQTIQCWGKRIIAWLKRVLGKFGNSQQPQPSNPNPTAPTVQQPQATNTAPSVCVDNFDEALLAMITAVVANKRKKAAAARVCGLEAFHAVYTGPSPLTDERRTTRDQELDKQLIATFPPQQPTGQSQGAGAGNGGNGSATPRPQGRGKGKPGNGGNANP